MDNQSIHLPGCPRNPEPPSSLQEIARTLKHPDVAQTGLTTTTEGEWALLVRIRRGATYPIAHVDDQARGYPVVYQQLPQELPIARPARPSQET